MRVRTAIPAVIIDGVKCALAQSATAVLLDHEQISHYTFETAELAMLEGKSNRLSPEELGLLARDLAAAKDAAEAGRIRERLTRGFYGV